MKLQADAQEKAWSGRPAWADPRLREHPLHGVFNIFHHFLVLFPSKGGDKFPSFEMWAELSDWASNKQSEAAVIVWTPRLEDKGDTAAPSVHCLWRKSATMLWGVPNGTTGWKTEDSHPQLCESFWKWFLQPQSSLQMTAGPANFLTMSSRDIPSQNHPVTTLLNSWSTETVSYSSLLHSST